MRPDLRLSRLLQLVHKGVSSEIKASILCSCLTIYNMYTDIRTHFQPWLNVPLVLNLFQVCNVRLKK